MTSDGHDGWNEEFDVVIAGSGIAGTAAAIPPARAGLRVLILEKTDKLGGATAYSGGQIWLAGNHVATDSGIADTVEEGVAYVHALSGEHGDEAMTRTILGTGVEAMAYFESSIGLRLHLLGFPDYYYPTLAAAKQKGRYLEPDPVSPEDVRDIYPFLRLPEVSVDPTVQKEVAAATSAPVGHLSAGMSLAAVFLAGAHRCGVELRVDAPMTGLVVHEGVVTGVECTIGGERRRIKAGRGVVIATGGYDWNDELMKAYEGIRTDNYGSTAPPGNDGDGFLIAAAHGATVATLPPHQAPMQLGYRDGTRSDGKPKWHAAGASPHGIIVNRFGRRFADESFYPQVNAHLHHFDGASCTYSNWPAFLVFDQTYRERISGPLSARSELPEGIVSQGGTIREVAVAAGVDPDGLEAQVQRWNELDELGHDEDFGRGDILWTKPRFALGSLGAIEQAPFYVMRLGRVGYGSPCAGLKVDASARVLKYGNTPIEGLYAAGNVAARVDVGILFQSGLANGRAMSLGYIAGRHLAAQTS
jgi:succinate dehydrogenase/fumarate reductase flavoprotein subunit